MDVTKITRTNNVSIFLLPLIPFTQGIFKYHIPYKGLGSRLLNAYLYDADVPKYQKNHISVVHTNVQDIGFRLFEKALENTPGFVDSYDIANTHYSVKVYRIPNDSLLSYEAFLRGEYSRFNLHDMASVLYYDYLGNKDYLTKVFKKDEDGEPIRFLDLSKKINVPSTVIQRVYKENFKGQGFLGRARNSTQVIDKIISTGVIDKDQIKKIARDKYNINIEDQNILKKINIAKDATVEQYVDDFKKMVSDPNYVPKFVKPAKEFGTTANQIKAKNIVKSTTEGFEEKLKKNINKRKKIKRDLDPIKREKDLVARAERRVKRRIKEKDVALTSRELEINKAQRAETRKLNQPIRNNPRLILDNKDIMEKLSITVSKDGDIIKVPPNLTEEYLKERGLFEIDHQRDIFKKGRGKNLPANRNLIAGPYNRAGGFKQMAEKFIEANPDPENPKVKNILKVAEDIQVTLQPNVKEGVFATKALGFKQAADPVVKFEETGLKWNNDIGAFVTPDEDIASQADLKKYAADNPMEVKVGEEPVKAATNKSVLANVGKAMARVGAPLPTAVIDSYFIGQQVKEGKGTAEIASNPLNWLGLATMEPLTKISGVAEGSGTLNKALRLGLNPATIRGISRFAGLPGLAVSTAMTAYDQYQKYKDGEGFIFNLLNQKGTE